MLFEGEDEIDGSNEQKTSHKMIPSEGHVEGDGRESDEDNKSDDLLNDFELHQAERASVALKAYAVSRNLQAVLKESDAPGEEDDEDKGCGIGKETGLLQFEMTVPSERHEDIRRD